MIHVTSSPASNNPKRSASAANGSAGASPGQRLAASAEFIEQLAETSDIDQVIAITSGGIRQLFQASRTDLWFVNQERSALGRVADSGHRAAAELSLSRYPSLRAALASHHPTTLTKKRSRVLADSFGAAVTLLVPLSVGNQRFGLLAIGWRQAQPVTKMERTLARVVGRSVGLAVANATHLHQLVSSAEAEVSHTRKLQRIYQVLQRFSKLKSEDAVLKLIPSLACSLLGYNYAVVERMQDNHLRKVELATRRPYNMGFAKLVATLNARPAQPDSLTVSVMKSQITAIVADPANDNRIRHRFTKQNFSSLAVVPLVVEGQSIGVLLVAQHRGIRPLDPADIELLNVFSKLCTYALNTLHHQTRRARSVDIARIPARTPEEFITAAVRQVPGTVSGRAGLIALPDAKGRLQIAAATHKRLRTARYTEWLHSLDWHAPAFKLVPPETGAGRRADGLKSSLLALIKYDKEQLGLIHVFDRAAGAFTVADQFSLKTTARRIGYVLKNLELVRQLTDERRQFASVVFGSADGILSIDEQNNIWLVNPAMEDLIGWSANEVIGKTCKEVFNPHGEDGGDFDFGWLRRATKRQSAPLVRNAIITTRSGSKRWVGITAASQIKDRGTKHTIVVVRDITEQHALQQRQQEFVSIASHELRTPLTALIGYLSLIQNEIGKEESPVAHFSSRAFGAATRLSELVEDLLNVARLEQGKLTFNIRPTNPAEVLSSAITNLQPAIARKHLNFNFRNNLSNRDLIKVDRSKLHQVIVNLIDNAIKYTPDSGKVTIRARANRKTISLIIQDTGIGIDRANLDRVFEKFFREYTDMSVGAGGTGLGLFISRELVEHQGGNLTLSSQQARGTTVTVTFPRYTPLVAAKRKPGRTAHISH